MAEEKKPAPAGLELWELLLILLVIASIASYISLRISAYLSTLTWDSFIGRFYLSFLNFLYDLKFYALVMASLFLLGIIYSVIRINEIVSAQKAALIPPESTGSKEPGNLKWTRILEHVNSPNPSDWKLAILEADIMLDDMVEKMGYHGETLGDRLKKVEKSDFTSIDSAWEAHKIRNSIAHEGSDFLITQREAQRVINLYKEVFEEFRYI